MTADELERVQAIISEEMDRLSCRLQEGIGPAVAKDIAAIRAPLEERIRELEEKVRLMDANMVDGLVHLEALDHIKRLEDALRKDYSAMHDIRGWYLEDMPAEGWEVHRRRDRDKLESAMTQNRAALAGPR